MTELAGDADPVGILRDRPARVSQQFPPRGTVTLLCPPDGTPEKYQNLQIAFGPFTGAVLAGAYEVGIQSRMDELDDLWAVILGEAFPTTEQRMPGGAPRASTRTAALGWRLLATVGSAIETLMGIADAIDHWRGDGQPTGRRCTIGTRLLNFSTSGADSVAGGLSRFGTDEAAAKLFGYPTEEIMSRHVTTREAEVIARRCERSAGLAAAIFRASAGVVEDPFWRTFMKWKHGIAVTSPGAAPLWLPDTPDLDVGRTQSRLETGIVVFDTKPNQSIYVWPAERSDFVVYSTFGAHLLDLCRALLGSVLGYAQPGPPALGWFEIDQEEMPGENELAALASLTNSPYPIAALAGQWH